MQYVTRVCKWARRNVPKNFMAQATNEARGCHQHESYLNQFNLRHFRQEKAFRIVFINMVSAYIQAFASK